MEDEDQDSNSFVRFRSPAFSQTDVHRIVELVEEFKNPLLLKSSAHSVRFAKEKAWEKLAKKFNHLKSSTDPERTANVLRTKWENLKRTLKVGKLNEGDQFLNETFRKIKQICESEISPDKQALVDEEEEEEAAKILNKTYSRSAANFSARDCRLLLLCVRQEKEAIFNSTHTAGKQMAWLKVSRQFNRQSPIKRHSKELKKKFESLKAMAARVSHANRIVHTCSNTTKFNLLSDDKNGLEKRIMPLTPAEKQRRFRNKRKLNPVKDEEARKKALDRYHKTKRLVKDLTSREHRQAKTKWRVANNKRRVRIDALQPITRNTPEFTPQPVNTPPTGLNAPNVPLPSRHDATRNKSHEQTLRQSLFLSNSVEERSTPMVTSSASASVSAQNRGRKQSIKKEPQDTSDDHLDEDSIDSDIADDSRDSRDHGAHDPLSNGVSADSGLSLSKAAEDKNTEKLRIELLNYEFETAKLQRKRIEDAIESDKADQQVRRLETAMRLRTARLELIAAEGRIPPLHSALAYTAEEALARDYMNYQAT